MHYISVQRRIASQGAGPRSDRVRTWRKNQDLSHLHREVDEKNVRLIKMIESTCSDGDKRLR